MLGYRIWQVSLPPPHASPAISVRVPLANNLSVDLREVKHCEGKVSYPQKQHNDLDQHSKPILLNFTQYQNF